MCRSSMSAPVGGNEGDETRTIREPQTLTRASGFVHAGPDPRHAGARSESPSLHSPQRPEDVEVSQTERPEADLTLLAFGHFGI